MTTKTKPHTPKAKQKLSSTKTPTTITPPRPEPPTPPTLPPAASAARSLKDLTGYTHEPTMVAPTVLRDLATSALSAGVTGVSGVSGVQADASAPAGGLGPRPYPGPLTKALFGGRPMPPKQSSQLAGKPYAQHQHIETNKTIRPAILPFTTKPPKREPRLVPVSAQVALARWAADEGTRDATNHATMAVRIREQDAFTMATLRAQEAWKRVQNRQPTVLALWSGNKPLFEAQYATAHLAAYTLARFQLVSAPELPSREELQSALQKELLKRPPWGSDGMTARAHELQAELKGLTRRRQSLMREGKELAGVEHSRAPKRAPYRPTTLTGMKTSQQVA